MVGEAPGLQEARRGVPFTGPSGKLLDAVLHHHGIERGDVLLANACSCRPPDNSTPPKMAIAACQPRLLSELQDRGVDTVVALGNTAAISLLGYGGVTKIRAGTGRKSDSLPGVRIIPTLHPAAALRQADLFPNIVTDIGKVNSPNVVFTPPVYVVGDTEDEAIGYLTQLENRPARPIVVDIEVDIEKDTSFDHPNQYGMLCTGLGYERGKALILGEGAMGSERVRVHTGNLLRSRPIVGQNFKFDGAGLYPLIGPVEVWFDTMIASYTFDERPGIHGLKYQAVEYLGAPQYDLEIKKYVGPGIGYGAIPRPLLYKYNAYDLVCTYDLKDMWIGRYEDSAYGPELRRVHDFLCRASNQLMYVELNGIAIDRDYLNQLERDFLVSLEGIEGDLDGIISRDPEAEHQFEKRGTGINPRSPLQVKKYFTTRNIDVPNTNKETLNLILDKYGSQISDEVRDFCTTLLKHRKEAKLYGTYVKGIRKRLYRGRVYPTFLLHGTTTGRLSCRNPNLQNIPRGSTIRRQFVPSKTDNVFVEADYAQAELRVLSFLAGDSYFRDIFNGGERDLFDELTPVLYKGAVRDEFDAFAWKELRIRVKAYVYGVSYGREAYSIAQEFDIPQGEAKRGMNAFFGVIPEIVAFREKTRRDVLAGNDLVTPFGRRRRYMLITKENVKDVMNEALAFKPQSTASDICLGAMTEIRQDLKGIGYVRNIVHDSILAECHRSRVDEVKEIMEKRMLESAHSIVGDYVKFAVDFKVGDNWGECS